MIGLDKINSKFDLNKLQFDLKEMDFNHLLDNLAEHNKAYSFILIIAALIVAWLLYKDYHVKEQAWHTKTTQAESKMVVIENRDAAVKNMNEFKASQPKEMNEYELITQLSNFANQYNVVITSLNPAEKKDMGLYDSVDVRFTIESDNFKNTMLFLRNIEISNFPFKINGWSGHADDKGKITSEIQISAVHLHI
jgi:hypothetical protein